MTVEAAGLMAHLAGLGVRFGLRGGQLALDAPAGVLTPARRAAVTTHQETIARLVRAATLPANDAAMNTCGALPHAPAGRCYGCGTRTWWRRPTGGWVCGVCHPAPPGIRGGAN